MATTGKKPWPTAAVGLAIVWLANNQIPVTQQQLFFGPADAQYWARLQLYALWTACFAGLALCALAFNSSRIARLIAGVTLALLLGGQLLLWYPARHDVTVRTSPGVYKTQRAGRTLVVYLGNPAAH